MKNKVSKGPQFLSYIKPLLQVLKKSGGSGPTGEIINQVIESMNIPDAEVEKTISSGASRIRNQIQWARMYLVNADLMDSSKRGIWKLTDSGMKSNLSDQDVHDLFRKVQGTFKKDSKPAIEIKPDEFDNMIVDDNAHVETLLEILKSLSPNGFERLCKRLLTELGIHDVQVTGQSGDQGVDGTGVLRLNDIIGFNIIFQCKRYKDTVSTNHVRDFRGTMQGRAEKGIILTTGRFTADAKRESSRDGVPPIELIDGDGIVELFEKYQLGLKPKTVYAVIPSFFDEYK